LSALANLIGVRSLSLLACSTVWLVPSIHGHQLLTLGHRYERQRQEAQAIGSDTVLRESYGGVMSKPAGRRTSYERYLVA
jgi:hypothetical protein